MDQKLIPWWGLAASPKMAHAGAVLRQACEIEKAILEGRSTLDRAIADHRAAKPKMGGNDRNVLSLAAYGLARNRDAIALALKGQPPGSGAYLSLALYDSVKDPEEIPEEIAAQLTQLNAVRSGLVSEIESGWDAPLAEIAPRKALSTLFSIPSEIIALGPWPSIGEAAAELNAGRFPQSAQLRVASNRMSRDRALAALAEKGLDATALTRSPWGVALAKRAPTGALAGLPVEFQDEGSQLAALACLPLEKGAKALDFCAGAGGKGLALAQAAEGEVYLHDESAARLAAAEPRIKKSGLANIRTLADPALHAPYALVLVDAPCSSTGTLRRNPEIGWRWNAKMIAKFAKTQREILDSAAALVAPGGLLVYVTCSLLEAENGAQATRFLSTHTRFQAEPPPHEAFRSVPGSEMGWFRLPLTLLDYSGDGFFIARFRKTS